MAGIQAIVNQYTGSSQGNPNPTYYALAKAEYGASGSSSCNSSKGNAVGSSCIFYDVTQGDMDLPCTGSHNCYKPTGTYGVLSTSNSAYQPAYGTQPAGWDFATGIGSVNAYNLVKAFAPSSTATPTTNRNAAATSTPTATATPTATFCNPDANCDRHADVDADPEHRQAGDFTEIAELRQIDGRRKNQQAQEGDDQERQLEEIRDYREDHWRVTRRAIHGHQ